jgi:hypothetical protein
MDSEEGKTFRVGLVMGALVIVAFFALVSSCQQGYYETLQRCAEQGLQLVRDQCVR